ncbi:uncharacterized protein LOC132543427 [Ylistrum balloti]|uniref:uncharacterized protein LOC132543427 n=1 Tax=Ylistrum balloti TaxID=509963 RepID=UPI002905E70D|nr:uncharacterized protein LOC132543427 [Ylistrum balloti]
MELLAGLRRDPKICTKDGRQVSNYNELGKGEKATSSRSGTSGIKTKSSDIYYPVTILQQNDQRSRVHYIGYSHKFDEWLERDAIKESRSTCMINSFLLQQLQIQIKDQLCSCGKKDTHKVIRIPINEQSLEDVGMLISKAVLHKVTHGKHVYCIRNRHALEKFLGVSWDFRIINQQGDNFYVITDTVRFWVHERKPMKEYILYPDYAEETYLNRGMTFCFAFVVSPGNKVLWPDLLNADKL